MKAPLIVLYLGLLVISSCQSSKEKIVVPAQVKEEFEKLHPHATDIQWIQETLIFEAKFKDGDLVGAVSFNPLGEIVETEQVIQMNALPNLEGIETYINIHYAGEQIGHCEKITKRDSTILYEIQITGKELVFDAAGNFKEEEPD